MKSFRIFLAVFTAFLLTDSLYAGGYLKFKDIKYGYSIDYPADWKVNELNEPLVKVNFMKDNRSGFQIRINQNYGDDLKAYARRHVPQFINEMQGARGGHLKILEQEHKLIGYNDGFLVTIAHKRPDESIYFYKQYMLVRGRDIYNFQCGCPWSERAQVEPILDRMADSFQFNY